MEYPFKDLLPLDEVLEREGYYNDWTHLDPEVFYSLTQISEYIKTKGYGVDVRLLISQLAEHFGLKTSQINEIEQLFNDVMKELSEDKNYYSLPEIAAARAGFNTLGARLNNTTAQFAQTASELESTKVGGRILAGMGNLSQEVKEAMTGGSVAVVGKGAVNANNLAEDMKYLTGIEKVNLNTKPLLNGYIDDSTGRFQQLNHRRATDYIEIDSSKTIYTNRLNFTDPPLGTQVAVFYDANKTFVGKATSDTDAIEPLPNSHYVRMTVVIDVVTESFDPEGFFLWQEHRSITKEKVDEIDSVLGLEPENIFDGSVVQGSVRKEDGGWIRPDNPSYQATGFIKINPNKEIITNWFNLLIQNGVTVNLNHVFYDLNKSFISAIESDSDIPVSAPENAYYVRYNLKGIGWSVDPSLFAVWQKSSKLDVMGYRIDTIKETVDELLLNKGLNIDKLFKVKVYDFYDANLTHSEIIKDCLDFTSIFPERVVIFDTIDWYIDEAILLPPNTTIIVDGVKIKQNDNVFDNIFRGDNLEIDPNDPYGYPLNIDTIGNIYIYGINGAVLEGPDVNVEMEHPTLGLQEAVGDFWGWRTLQISFSKCENFEISGFGFEKTRCWAMSFDKCTHFKVYDIDVKSNVKNGDGVNVRFGCHDFEVYNITGSTSDDSVALNTIDYFPSGSYVYPMEPSAFENDSLPSEDLHIYNGYVEKVHTTGQHHGVICLANSGRKIFDVLINDIKEPTPSNRESVVIIYSGYGSGYNANDISRIRINNVLSKGATHAVQITHKVDDVWVNKVTQERPDGNVSTIANMDGVTITNS